MYFTLKSVFILAGNDGLESLFFAKGDLKLAIFKKKAIFLRKTGT